MKVIKNQLNSLISTVFCPIKQKYGKIPEIVSGYFRNVLADRTGMIGLN